MKQGRQGSEENMATKGTQALKGRRGRLAREVRLATSLDLALRAFQGRQDHLVSAACQDRAAKRETVATRAFLVQLVLEANLEQLGQEARRVMQETWVNEGRRGLEVKRVMTAFQAKMAVQGRWERKATEEKLGLLVREDLLENVVFQESLASRVDEVRQDRMDRLAILDHQVHKASAACQVDKASAAYQVHEARMEKEDVKARMELLDLEARKATQEIQESVDHQGLAGKQVTPETQVRAALEERKETLGCQEKRETAESQAARLPVEKRENVESQDRQAAAKKETVESQAFEVKQESQAFEVKQVRLAPRDCADLQGRAANRETLEVAESEVHQVM